MRENPDLLAGIYEQPDDDAPRLVYADWLEEHGELERAEVIRLQCMMARQEPYSEKEDDRAFDLVEINRAAWTAHLPQADGATWEFHRGFPEELAIEMGLLLEQWSVWAPLPRVRALTLYGATAHNLQTFATMPWNRGWTALHFFEEPKPWLHMYPYDLSTGVRAVVLTPQVRQVDRLVLDFFDHWLGADAIAASLCESPHLGGLLTLGVNKQLAEHSQLVHRFGTRLKRSSLPY